MTKHATDAAVEARAKFRMERATMRLRNTLPACLLMLLPALAGAQSRPTNPVRIIVSIRDGRSMISLGSRARNLVN